MKKLGKQGLIQVVILLACAAVGWITSSTVESSEFSGGRVTGPLLILQNTGIYLLMAAMLLTFFFRRVGAGIAVMASIISLPFYLYFVFPALFRTLFKGEYSVPLHAAIVWNKWGIIGILLLTLAVYICLRSFMLLDHRKGQQFHQP